MATILTKESLIKKASTRDGVILDNCGRTVNFIVEGDLVEVIPVSLVCGCKVYDYDKYFKDSTLESLECKEGIGVSYYIPYDKWLELL